MNPETDKQLASLIEAAKQTGSDVASFIQQQAPELCEQIVAWEFWSGIGGVAFGCVCVFFAVLSVWAASRHEDKSPYDDTATGFLFCAGFMVVVGLLFGGLGAGQAIKSKVAPKVVVMEAITKALNPAK